MDSAIHLPCVEREELTQRVASRSGRADQARRARLILLLDAGQRWAAIRSDIIARGVFPSFRI